MSDSDSSVYYDDAVHNGTTELARLLIAETEWNPKEETNFAAPQDRNAQSLFIQEKWNAFPDYIKAEAYHLFMKKKTKDGIKKRQAYPARDPTQHNFHDFVLQQHYEREYEAHFTSNECTRLRYHGMVLELERQIDDAKNPDNITWHQQQRQGSDYNGHYYIKMKDVLVLPQDNDEENPIDIKTVPIISRYEAKVPMGNCDECYWAGRLRKECHLCDGTNHTLNFNYSRRKRTDRSGIVHPKELAEINFPRGTVPIKVDVLLGRSDTPLRWTAISFKNPNDYIDSRLIERVNAAQVHRNQIYAHARAIKLTMDKVERKYNRIRQQYLNDQMFIVRTIDTDNESAMSTDKNIIGGV